MPTVTSPPGRRWVSGAALFLVALLHAAPAAALDELLVGVTLNEVDKGVHFAFSSPEGDLLFAGEDLREMGFGRLPGTPVDLGGRPHHSLRGLGASYDFNTDAMSVRITAPPELLALKVIDFLAGVAEEVEYPVARSAFLNYRLNYRTGGGASSDIDLAAEVGARARDFLFLSDAIYRRSGGEGSFTRLATRASWEDREKLQRVTLGDFTASPGDLWGSANLGGLSFSRLYRMDPYQARHPTFGFAGQTPLPAEVRLYLNGALVRTEQLAPGKFEIRNLDSYGGASGVEVVIRDVFGRETRIARPFYFTDAVLRAGLHEFSYGLGWVREGFGSASSSYDKPALSFFHRHGYSDTLTLGLAGEAGDGAVSAGPTLSLVAGSQGTVSLALSAGKGGVAGLVAHEYQAGRLSTRFRFRSLPGGYRRVGEEPTADRPEAAFDAGVGFGGMGTGTLSLDYSSQWQAGGPDRSRISVNYQLGLRGRVSAFATVGYTVEGAKKTADVVAGLSWFPGRERTLTAQYRGRDGDFQVGLDYSRDLHEGEGLAWKGLLEGRDDGALLRPSAEYHGKVGIWGGSLDLEKSSGGRSATRLSLSAAGSVLAAGGVVGMGRPVQDSFALVKVGEEGLPGVRVYQGGSLRGTTDRKGSLLIPEIGSYVHNQISIEPKDIPMGYSIDQVTKVISPAERSGSVVGFEVARYQAVTGKLVAKEGEARRPLEFLEIRARAGGLSSVSPTGKGGEFFLENVGSGSVELGFTLRGRDRACAIVVPKSEEIIVDIGEVVCEIAP